MTEYQAKKLGEVLAFLRVGIETAEKGREGLEKIFSTKDIEESKKQNQESIESVEKIGKEKGVLEAVLEKAEKTGEKLRKMRDMYVGDEWGDSAELMEWAGFFEGAAIVHWSLVEGAAEAGSIEELKNLSEDAIENHKRRLASASEKLKEVGVGK